MTIEPTPASAVNMKEYVAYCRMLLRDVEHVIADATLLRDDWKLRYAVDFSEIYNYVLPDDTHETSSIDDGWFTPLRQYMVLSRFFGERDIVLTPGYALELRSFYLRLADRSLVSNLKLYMRAVQELELLRQRPEFDRVQALAKEHRERRLVLTSEEVNQTIEFFRNSPVLVAHTRGVRLEPMLRLHDLLFKRKPFTDLERFAPQAPAHTDETVERAVFKELVERRKGPISASLIDAQAVETIRAANLVLRPRKERLLLVSRSMHMNNVVERLSREYEAWGGVDAFIRHPRTFSDPYHPAGKPTDEFMERLNQRRELLRLFLNAADSATDGKSSAEQSEDKPAVTQEELQKLAKSIEQSFGGGETLALALEDTGEIDAADQATLAKELLSFLRDDDELERKARIRVQEIWNEALRGLGVLGIKMQTTEALGSVLYPIKLEDPELTELVKEYALRWNITIAQALEFAEKASRPTIRTSDFFLATAISLGAIGRWPLAEEYAGHAITQRLKDGESTREARFFRALCVRKTAREADPKLRESIADLYKAITECGSDPDLRYLSELGVQEARLATTPEERDTAIRQFEEVLASPSITAKMKIQTLNNLAFIHTHKHPITNPGAAQDYLARLEKEFGKVSRKTWPPYVIDTLVYGRFQLRSDTIEPAELQRAIEELEPIQHRGDLTRAEFRIIQGHVLEMQKKLEEIGRPAPAI
jgi:hypothetical protein